MVTSIYLSRTLIFVTCVTISCIGHAQEMSGLLIGGDNAPVFEKQKPFVTLSDLDLNLASQQPGQSPGSYFEVAADFGDTISSDLDFEESRNAYIALLNQAAVCNSKRVPVWLYQTRRTIIARWPGKIAPFRQTDLIMEEPPAFAGRMPDDHFEIVWNGRNFALIQYQNIDNRVRRCPPRPAAVPGETIKLQAQVLESALVLSPIKMRGVIPLYIVIEFDGLTSTEVDPSFPRAFRLMMRNRLAANPGEAKPIGVIQTGQ